MSISDYSPESLDELWDIVDSYDAVLPEEEE